MCKQKQLLTFLLFLLCSFSGLKSQIVVSPTVGCSPVLLGVTFQYTGSATNLTNIVWNFGDNSPTSSSLSPTHNYVGTGTFIVTFNATGLPTYTSMVVVHQSPTAAFNYVIPATHCAPMAVSFSGTSSAPNSSFTYVYGDGGIGNTANNTYNYTIGGSFTAILTVSDIATGCTGTVSHGPINVSTPPVINISANPGTATCSAPFTTAFTASTSLSGSPIGGGLTFSWNFGNSQSSSAPTPGNITYNTAGIYTLSLTATDNNNCSKTNTLLVSIFTPTLNVTAPATVCIRPQNPPSNTWPQFLVTAVSNVTTLTWQMGDGNTKIFPSPNYQPAQFLTPNVPKTDSIHSYTSPGLKTLTITASAGGCITTVTKTIFVEEIIPQFTVVPPSTVCTNPMVITYTNQSTLNSGNTMTYFWTASNWNQAPPLATSTQTNATFTFTQGSLNPYTIFTIYNPTVVLNVKSVPVGCIAQVNHAFDRMKRPTAWFNMSSSGGCAPLTVNFRDSSFDYLPLYPISNWTWNNGGIGSAMQTVSGTGSVIPVTPFTYNTQGVYHPFLTITTGAGCTHTSFQGTITVMNPPVFSYLLPTSPVCAGVPVQIKMQSTTGGVQHWHVDADKGYFSGCVSDSTPVWKFTHVGVQSVTLSAYASGCKSSIVVPNAITVKGPVAKGRYESDCSTPKVAKFYYHLQDAVSGSLDFGDGSPVATLTGAAPNNIAGTITHTYNLSGNYKALLRGFNGPNACQPYVDTIRVNIRQLAVDFTLTPVLCKGVYQTITLTQSNDVEVGCGTGYTWLYDNQAPEASTSTLFVSSTTFSALGQHVVSLLVKDVNGCTMLVTKNFTVASPIPTFTFNSNPICVSGYPAQMVNLTPQTPYAVTNYTFVMGDWILPSTPQTTVSSTTTAVYSPTFNFPMGTVPSRTFSVLLKAKDINGCVDSIRNVIKVSNPQAFFYPTVTGACYPPGQKITFIVGTASTYTNYNINFGDSTAFNYVFNSVNNTYGHTYSGAGSYSPVITVTDNIGCTKTYSASPFVVQNYPKADFIMADAITGEIRDKYCMPAIIQYTNTSVLNNPPNTGYLLDWNGLGNNLPTISSSVVAAQYTNNGVYTITLTIYTLPSFCSSTKVKTISVFKPLAQMTVSQSTLCLGETLEMKILNRTGVDWWVWEYGVNSAQSPTLYSQSQPVNASHFYTYNSFPNNPTGTVTVRLNYIDPQRACPSYKDTVIKVLKIDADFNRNNELTVTDSIHCLGIPDVFKPNNYTNSPSTLTYTWSYGPGLSSISPTLIYNFPSPGTYSIGIRVVDPVYGCKDNIVKNVKINPLPTAFVNIKDTLCPNTLFNVTGGGTPGVSGGLTGTLSPYSSDSLIFDSQNTFSLSTSALASSTYSLVVKDNNGCYSPPATKYIYVQQSATRVDWDTTVIIGQHVYINSYAGSNFTYTWTPVVIDLNCLNCYNPITTTTNNITYSVTVEDKPLGCFRTINTYKINIDPRTTVDVPTAFTPNGDGTNDRIYADGWGIKKLFYFRIYNRWGQMLFETNDVKTGWDGRHEGILQNMETYVYQVSVETYTNETISKSGTFKLIR